MNRNTALKILNPVLGVLVLNQLLTGFFAEDLPHEAFEILHEGGAFVFAAAILLHVTLNWNWVISSFIRAHSTG